MHRSDQETLLQITDINGCGAPSSLLEQSIVDLQDPHLGPYPLDPGITLSSLQQQYEHCKKRWEEMRLRTEFRQIFLEMIPDADADEGSQAVGQPPRGLHEEWKLNTVVYVALGSPSSSHWERLMGIAGGRRDTSLMQLTVLEEWIIILRSKQHPIGNKYVQDPLLNPLDAEFLATLSYTTVYGSDATQYVSQWTFFFAPHAPGEATERSLREGKPGLYVGNDLLEEYGENRRLLPEWIQTFLGSHVTFTAPSVLRAKAEWLLAFLHVYCLRMGREDGEVLQGDREDDRERRNGPKNTHESPGGNGARGAEAAKLSLDATGGDSGDETWSALWIPSIE